MDLIRKTFPHLGEEQVEQFTQLEKLYIDLNQKVNVISRKDIHNIYLHHVMHSMFIQFIIDFKPGSEVLDLGTGGGFPGIPLAILYPDVRFFLIDGTKKKIGVVEEVIHSLGLKNVRAKQVRAEELKNHKFDFIVSRAVASLDKLISWSRPLIKTKQQHAIPNGLFAWKGGNISKEIQSLPSREYIEKYPLTDYLDHEYYKEKYILYVQG